MRKYIPLDDPDYTMAYLGDVDESKEAVNSNSEADSILTQSGDPTGTVYPKGSQKQSRSGRT